MIDHHGELLAVGGIGKGLHHRLTIATNRRALIERAGGERGNCADWRYPGRPVDEVNGDFVAAKTGHTRVDEGIGARRGRRIQPVDQILQRAGGAVAVVLHFHQTNDICIEADDGADRLGALAVELGQGVRAARGGEAAAQAVAVEVVQHVEAGDAHIAAHGRRRDRARVAVGDADRRNRLDHVFAAIVEQHAGQPADGVACAQRVRRAEARRRVDNGIAVLLQVGIIHQDATAVVQVLQQVTWTAGAAGQHQRGRLVEAVVDGE